MKRTFTYILLFTALLFLLSCQTGKNQKEILVYYDSTHIENGENIKLSFYNGKSFNHPSFVVWTEDMQGNYINTLYITQSYASGIFAFQMYGDTVWYNNPGPSYQPAALPYWTSKKGEINQRTTVPTEENPFVDAYTGATPKNNFQFICTTNYKKPYRVLIEINQTWDWNKFWTNNKYPESAAYKHSAQPSIIYAVSVNHRDSLYSFNPIGHGDPKGEGGKLYTDLRTLSSAKEIFEHITLEILP